MLFVGSKHEKKISNRQKEEEEEAKDELDDTSEIFPGHMVQVQTWDCPSAKQKSSWRRFFSSMCAHICLPFLKHLTVMVIGLINVFFPSQTSKCCS